MNLREKKMKRRREREAISGIHDIESRWERCYFVVIREDNSFSLIKCRMSMRLPARLCANKA